MCVVLFLPFFGGGEGGGGGWGSTTPLVRVQVLYFATSHSSRPKWLEISSISTMNTDGNTQTSQNAGERMIGGSGNLVSIHIPYINILYAHVSSLLIYLPSPLTLQVLPLSPEPSLAKEEPETLDDSPKACCRLNAQGPRPEMDLIAVVSRHPG